MFKIKNTSILFLFCILVTKSTVAQNDSLERNICHGLFNQVTAAITEGDADYFYTAYQTTDTDAIYHRPYIAKLGELGSTIWKRIPFDTIYQTGGVFHIHFDYDSNLIISGVTTLCDVVDGNGYVEKIMRTNGSRIWIKSFKRNANFGNSMITMADSTYLVTDGTGIMHLSNLGDSIGYSQYNQGDMRSIMQQINGHYIVQSDSGLLRLNSNGVAVNAYFTNLGINHAVVGDSGSVFFNTNIALFKVDSALAGMLSYNPPANVVAFTDMVDNENRLWLLAQLNNNTSRLIKLDYDFNFLAGHTFSYFNDSDLTAQKILVNIHDYDLLFAEKLLQGQALVLKSWAKTGNLTYHYNNDCGIAALIVDSTYATINTSGGSTQIQAFMNTKVCIKNYGNRPVSKIQLHGLVPNTMGACALPAYVFTIDTLLPVADSIWIDLGWLSTGYFDTIQLPFDLCLYTAAADNLMDYNHDNDSRCVTVSINTFTGINENIKSVQMWPNPATSQITLNSTTSGMHFYKITDITGRLIMSGKYDSNNTVVNITKLGRGVYFVETDTGTARLLKQ